MLRADHFLTFGLTDTHRKAHFWGSVENVNVKQQNLTIIVCLRCLALTFFCSRISWKVETKNLSMILIGIVKREIIFLQLPSSLLPSSLKVWDNVSFFKHVEVRNC